MKKILFFCAFLCVVLSSCMSQMRYIGDETISLNYNNISARWGIGTWLTQDAAYFLEDNLIQSYYKVSNQGKEMLAQNNGGGFGKIEVYGDTAYLLDHDKSINPERTIYRFRMLDLETKKAQNIAKVENVERYFYLDGNIFAMCYEWQEDECVKSIKMISLPDGRVSEIATSVFACGVRNGEVNYVAVDNDKYSVHRFDIDEKRSHILGEFYVSTNSNEMISELVNFTSDYVIMTIDNEKEVTSKMLKYNIVSGELTNRQMDYCISEIVAFDKTAFILGTKDFESDSSLQKSKLYSINIATEEIEQLYEFVGYSDIIVTSDNDFYIWGEDLEHYSTSGKKANPFV